MRWALTGISFSPISALATKRIIAHAQEPSEVYTVFGLGNDRCAAADQGVNADVAGSRVFRYFSALNVISQQYHYVGAGANADVIMEAVKLVCDANPSEPFFNAVSAVYLKLRQEVR